MSEPESFAARWSRLKLKAKTRPDTPPGPEDARAQAQTVANSSPPSSGSGDRKEPAFDLSTLPSIDSIVAGTDIRAFLQAGVPAELARAALRKAWSADTSIRDFIGIAENQWDFTDPSAIPGFGPLRAQDDIGQLVRQAMGELKQSLRHEGAPEPTPHVSAQAPGPEPVSVQIPGMPDESASKAESGTAVKANVEPDIAAPQHDEQRALDRRPNRRGHGQAVPK